MIIHLLRNQIKTGLTAISIVSFVQWSQAQNQLSSFHTTYSLIQEKDFFNAKKQFEAEKNSFPKPYQDFTDAILLNAFNKPDLSEKKIVGLISSGSSLPDSLMLKVYRTREDNAMKQYDYRSAKKMLETIRSRYGSLLSAEEKDDLENTMKIWTALEQQPHQKTQIKSTTSLKTEKDKAGLKNLKVTINGNSADFIFDTGANLSVMTESAARRFGMNIIPAGIKVDAITGASVTAGLAVCKKMTMGNITVENAVFLVFPDTALAFPQISYQINGILGFPVIESFKEVQMTRDGYFIVPKEETKINAPSNMAIDGLTPMIEMDGMHFSFDTGAERSMLYYPYYLKNKPSIDQKKTVSISLGGAGGTKTYQGAEIRATFHILDQEVTLDQLNVLKENFNKHHVYGNIGQDVISRFQKLILNFDKMFIKFE
ncbi:MAG: retropepsin-like domain-containing protein [Chryseobacterium sp.]|jgi:predicted aspartyl protease|uniref:retropepsin-like aspartic protease family protein n=1 Tax=Chryseobacterium sp. TaxID=1871047 RepID=UPI002824ECB6|nr:retropepsin-like aspartic protease [Chryseobacterium sp.]MDR2235292.1 retropepsin-like domain-containing protein [Chryseobacterium sp.]